MKNENGGTNVTFATFVPIAVRSPFVHSFRQHYAAVVVPRVFICFVVVVEEDVVFRFFFILPSSVVSSVSSSNLFFLFLLLYLYLILYSSSPNSFRWRTFAACIFEDYKSRQRIRPRHSLLLHCWRDLIVLKDGFFLSKTVP